MRHEQLGGVPSRLCSVDLPPRAVLQGLQNLIDDYLGLRSSDFVVLCCRSGLEQPATWLLMAVSALGCGFIYRMVDEWDDARLERELDDMVRHRKPEQGRVVLIVAEDETVSFTSALRKAKAQHNQLEVLRVMNFGEALFVQGLVAKRSEIRRVNAKLLRRLMPARQLRVTSALGTDLKVTLGSEFEWVSSHGFVDPGELPLIPAGEINTYPASIDGQFVAEGAIHANRNIDFDARLAQYPIRLQIEKSCVTDWSCDSPDVQRFLDWMFSTKHGRRVGEFGIGTNVGIRDFTRSNSHLNERHPGIHLGFGEHTQPDKVEYVADYHMDVISPRAFIEIDEGEDPIDVSCLSGSDEPHPDGTRAEDLEHTPVRALTSDVR